MTGPGTNGAQPTNASLQTVQESMLDGLGQLASYFGFSKVMGQLYGALLLSKSPLSLDDLVELLDISKASVSMNLRTLEHMGMVRQVWVRGGGGRRKFYEAETDFWQIISNVLSGREMRDVERAITVMDHDIERLRNAIPSMTDAERQQAQLYIDRIISVRDLFRFAQTLITGILTRTDNSEH
jgi:HTH-type transcriptional regulator, glycine betaine synthesis regulator